MPFLQRLKRASNRQRLRDSFAYRDQMCARCWRPGYDPKSLSTTPKIFVHCVEAIRRGDYRFEFLRMAQDLDASRRNICRVARHATDPTERGTIRSALSLGRNQPI